MRQHEASKKEIIMELVVILVVLAVIVLGVMAYASYDHVGAAAARSDLALGAPGGADVSGWSGLVFEWAVILLVLTVFAVVLFKVVVPWVRKQMKGPGKGWKSGPNARWGRTDEPKMDTEKLMQLAILSKLAGGDSGVPLILQQPEAPQETQQSQLPEGWWQ